MEKKLNASIKELNFDTIQRSVTTLKWEKVKSLYKNQWVIIEAIEAYSKDSERILDEISVVDIVGNDSKKALEIYKKLHRENKDRELYVVHTSRDKLDIKEKTWIGVRK